jgi:hypothetical protein
MNKKLLLAYILIVTSAFLFTASLTTYNNTINYRNEVAMKKVEEARNTKDINIINEAKELIKNVISDNVKQGLIDNIESLEVDIEKDKIKDDYLNKLNEIESSLDENKLNEIKESINKIKYGDIKKILNEKIVEIDNKITEKKLEEERKRKEEEERKRKEEEAAIARQNAYNILVQADNESVNSTPPQDVQVIETVNGNVTAFTPYCSDGCHGYVASGKYVGEGNIHYYDNTYGKVYIVAGGPEYPLGTIVRLKNLDYFGGRDIYAIVLDRGGAIGKGRRALFDLLFALESNANNFGVRYGVTCEILRLGY